MEVPCIKIPTPRACVPVWRCDTNYDGTESDGCGNRRENHTECCSDKNAVTAFNPDTLEDSVFPNRCDIPRGWIPGSPPACQIKMWTLISGPYHSAYTRLKKTIPDIGDAKWLCHSGITTEAQLKTFLGTYLIEPVVQYPEVSVSAYESTYVRLSTGNGTMNAYGSVQFILEISPGSGYEMLSPALSINQPPNSTQEYGLDLGTIAFDFLDKGMIGHGTYKIAASIIVNGEYFNARLIIGEVTV